MILDVSLHIYKLKVRFPAPFWKYHIFEPFVQLQSPILAEILTHNERSLVSRLFQQLPLSRFPLILQKMQKRCSPR